MSGIEPDLVVIAGDLTAEGYEWEYEQAAAWLERIEFPKVVIPGNHDARNVGYVHFQPALRRPLLPLPPAFEPRASRTAARDRLHDRQPRLVRAGRQRGQGRPRPLPVALEQFDEPGDIRIVAVHHHLVPIPGTGRERNIVLDAGDLLLTLVGLDVDIVSPVTSTCRSSGA